MTGEMKLRIPVAGPGGALALASEVRVCGRENLTASHVRRQGMSREDLIVRDGHEILRENYKISELAGLDRPLHLLFERSVRAVHGEQTQGFGPADLLPRT